MHYVTYYEIHWRDEGGRPFCDLCDRYEAIDGGLCLFRDGRRVRVLCLGQIVAIQEVRRTPIKIASIALD